MDNPIAAPVAEDILHHEAEGQIRCLELVSVSHSDEEVDSSQDEGRVPEVRPEVDDLPSAECNQSAHGANGEPLDALVGALVGVPQLLFASTKVVHLGDNLGNQLFDATQLSLDGLELLVRLDG